jgi:hypothetical protein
VACARLAAYSLFEVFVFAIRFRQRADQCAQPFPGQPLAAWNSGDLLVSLTEPARLAEARPEAPLTARQFQFEILTARQFQRRGARRLNLAREIRSSGSPETVN